ncbi:membrane-bound metal-dependent hydrolase [Halovivax asiaticus JCM 14624]|uniref:Membrane-bound metal-dependent hydrolase n=1 Tax=Halovivax asiaticus JCM 14624 TaxID=1227490 RepID=M0BR51_9EURY|nr:metal-dependent hydrolase [Halovivax asiaticus]ELZ13420.1 membrane-bound metal-dependent hydrolase [Halovivax asiaticus JCM 14624]
MFVGHALFAFAVAALFADWRGWRVRTALAFGIVAGAFAAVPDVDVAYAFVGLAHWVTADGSVSAPTAFWDASRATHRSITHSLLVATIAAPAFGFLAAAISGPSRRVALGAAVVLSGGLVVLAVAAGPLTAMVLTVFLVAGGLVTVVATRETTLTPAWIGIAALWGLWSHPWGDLLTGDPPAFLFPLDRTLFEARVIVSSDPTLHLLSAFAVELGAIVFATLTVFYLTERDPVVAFDVRGSVGALYGVSVLFLTPPTLDVSYHFVFSILGVGVLVGTIRTVPFSLGLGGSRSGPFGWSMGEPNGDGGWSRLCSIRRTLPPSASTELEPPTLDDVLAGVLTAIGAISAALLTYTMGYLLVS